MNAYYIQKLAENVEHVIYEKNEDIGGYESVITLVAGIDLTNL
jgi:protoporphyrinogen oxidase